MVYFVYRLAEYSKPVVPFSTSGSSKSSDPILRKISYKQTKVQYPNVFDSSLDSKNTAGKLNQENNYF